jgi:hypothetical protein
MSLGLCFWVIFIVAIVFFGAIVGGAFYGQAYGHIGSLVDLVLFALLGWKVFGPPVHG